MTLSPPAATPTSAPPDPPPAPPTENLPPRPPPPDPETGPADPADTPGARRTESRVSGTRPPEGVPGAADGRDGPTGAGPHAACPPSAANGAGARTEPRCARCGRPWPRTTPSAPTPCPSLDARRPSRLHAIEELPVALGMVVVSGGDFRHAVLGAVNYGRDCDSIATMAGAVTGALGSPVPEGWAKTVAEASRLDLLEPAAALTEVAREIFARDVSRRRSHEGRSPSWEARNAPTDLGPAGGPDRARAAPGRPGRPVGCRRRRRRGPVARGGRLRGPTPRGRLPATGVPLPPAAGRGPPGRTRRPAQWPGGR
ncbi:hypothetical protein SHIRM173S_05793 [Streptomyces hirsutus]